MSIKRVAEMAGVSISTVSRVLNDQPGIASSTARSVRAAATKLRVKPVRRKTDRGGHARPGGRVGTIGFLVFGNTGSPVPSTFERLLRGVSDACADHDLSLVFGFVSSPADLPPRLGDKRLEGLLLHGQRPDPTLRPQLETIPTVWLMANRQRPLWGDQVMPDNTAIGELAARYLLQRGHRKLAFLKSAHDGWSLKIRALAFLQAAQEADAFATLLQAAEPGVDDFWCSNGLGSFAGQLVDQLLAMPTRPTGLCVAEDRLLPAIDAELARRGIAAGPGESVELISCNNERPHFVGVRHPPATIDIRGALIGRLGVEQLLWRIRSPDAGRATLMIEPALVEPDDADE